MNLVLYNGTVNSSLNHTINLNSVLRINVSGCNEDEMYVTIGNSTKTVPCYYQAISYVILPNNSTDVFVTSPNYMNAVGVYDQSLKQPFETTLNISVYIAPQIHFYVSSANQTTIDNNLTATIANLTVSTTNGMFRLKPTTEAFRLHISYNNLTIFNKMLHNNVTQ